MCFLSHGNSFLEAPQTEVIIPAVSPESTQVLPFNAAKLRGRRDFLCCFTPEGLAPQEGAQCILGTSCFILALYQLESTLCSGESPPISLVPNPEDQEPVTGRRHLQVSSAMSSNRLHMLELLHLQSGEPHLIKFLQTLVPRTLRLRKEISTRHTLSLSPSTDSCRGQAVTLHLVPDKALLAPQ